MAVTDPLIGRQLGDYVIESVLGTGGMARVYKGFDPILTRYAAVKVIEPRLSDGDDETEYRERFLREARAIARLEHHGIVSVYQFGQRDTLYYIAMQFVDGLDLRQLSQQRAEAGDGLSHAEILRILTDIATALDYAHSRDIIHRDIKPSNILVRADGSAVLTDFGLALDVMEGTTGETFGSVHYIAPEQAMSSAQAVAQSDQYSLGIVAFEMLTGQVPFDDPSAMSVALKHISEPPPPPTTVCPDLPAAVDTVVGRVMNKAPEARYESCMAFIHALEESLRGIQPETRPMASVVSSVVRQPVPSTDVDAPTVHGLDELQSEPAAPFADAWALPSEVSSVDAPVLPAVAHGKAPRLPLLLILIVMVLGIVAVLLMQMGATAVDPTPTGQALALVSTEVTQTQATNTDAPTFPASVTPRSAVLMTQAEETESAEATNTPRPTHTPTSSSMPASTSTPSDTPVPTRTAMPTRTSTPGFVVGEEEPPLLLRYDGRTLVLFNRSEEVTMEIEDLQFHLFEPDQEGEIVETNVFDAGEWRNIDDGLSARTCVQVWTIAFTLLPPDEAPADICSSRTAFRSTSRSFWVSNQASDSYFEVRRGPVDVIATCPVLTTGTFREQRCVIRLRP